MIREAYSIESASFTSTGKDPIDIYGIKNYRQTPSGAVTIFATHLNSELSDAISAERPNQKQLTGILTLSLRAKDEKKRDASPVLVSTYISLDRVVAGYESGSVSLSYGVGVSFSYLGTVLNPRQTICATL